MGGRGRGYVFTKLVLFGTSGPFGDHFFLFYGFTGLLCLPTSGPFGDPLSGLPERGERATASSQTAHPSFPAGAEKLSRSVAPPFPTKPAGAGLWRGPLKAAPVGSPGVMLTGFDESVPDVCALVPRPNFNQGRRWRLSPPLRAYCGCG